MSSAAGVGGISGTMLRLTRGKPLGALGGILILVLVATALLAPVLALYDPIKIKSADRLQAPGEAKSHRRTANRLIAVASLAELYTQGRPSAGARAA